MLVLRVKIPHGNATFKFPPGKGHKGQLFPLNFHLVVPKLQVVATATRYNWQKPMGDEVVQLKRLDPCEVAQTFSHYSFVYSQREMLVVDLQGTVISESQRTVLKLTDPAIHTGWWRNKRYKRLSHTDKGETGIGKFFEHHECNALCGVLGIKY